MSFKAIGFDYGGVISGLPGPEFNQGVVKLLGVNLDEYQTAWFRHNRVLNIDGLPFRDFFKIVLKDLNKEDKLEAALAYFNDQPNEINQKVLGLIDQLKSSGYKVGLLSNNSIEAADEMRRQGINKHFDVFLVSAEIGLMKPSKESFNMLIEKLRVKPKELIFVDDSNKSLELAPEIGFYPIQFINYKDLSQKLDDLGILKK